MKEIDIKTLQENFFDAIGTEWMLVTAGQEEHFNLMTASWGGIGFLWNKPVAFVFIRPERYTYEFAERSEYITLSFLGTSKDAREIYKICGNESGRNINKVEICGLETEIIKGGVTYKQSRLTLVGRKIYAEAMKFDCFTDTALRDKYYGPKDAHHKQYILEIVGAYIKE